MFNIFDYIDPLYFAGALCLGLLYAYLTTPPPKVVIKYPTPFNTQKTTYVDPNGICYKYRIKKVACPADRSKIKKYTF